MDIRDNVFIVSGGASGLGAATVRMLVDEGARVVVADVRDGGRELVERDFGESATWVRCDVSSEPEVQSAVAAAEALGPLRGVVNCAGVLAGERVLGRDGPHRLETFERIMRVNLIGTFNMVRLCAQAMSRATPLADGERGVIVNTASIAAFEGQVGQAAYAASKGGVVAMTLPVARDLARHAIRCVAIAPGNFETPMMAALKPEAVQAMAAQVPFPARLGRGPEFAHLVRSIIQNPMLNGTTIRLDGALRLPPK